VARYPGSENDRRIERDVLERVVQDAFAGCGMSQEDAERVTDSLVHADMRGIHSHGVMRVPTYANSMLGGGIDPKGRPTVARDSGAAIVVDGGNAMGQVATTFAMKEAITRARDVGVCAAAIGSSNHCGAMDYYALMAAEADMIGYATTNALPTMAPFGGADQILGINPVGIAFPSAKHGPLVFDTSFGATARGRIQVFNQKGLDLPEGWAMDSDGNPTTDPAVALKGLIAPAGAHKGSGFSLMMGLLSTVLSGASYGVRLGSVDTGPNPGQDGQFVLAMNAAAFEDPSAVKDRVDDAVDEILSSRTGPGFDRVVPPGWLEADLMAEYGRDGIPLNAETIANIKTIAGKVGTDASALG